MQISVLNPIFEMGQSNMQDVKSSVDCRQTRWRGRRACVLSNDRVQLTHLTGGGQIADFHLLDADQMNPFWIPHWPSRDPGPYRADRDEPLYGPPEIGKLLSVITGHSLCLETFGMPSEEEIRTGAALHGEAGLRRWRSECTSTEETGTIRFNVSLPGSQISFSRMLSLHSGESIVRIREEVTNRLAADQYIQWQQHATVAPPFAAREDCRIILPGAQGVTASDDYEGQGLLACGAEFHWPHVPAASGGNIDLRVPLQKTGTGFVSGVRIDPRRHIAFVCAINHRRNLAFGYVFRRNDFPWITLWEENRARTAAPWSGVEQARAIEFGVSPLPIGRAETLRRGELFNTPVIARLPAKGSLIANYVLFIAKIFGDPQSITDIACGDNELRLLDRSGKTVSTLPARGIQEFLGGAESV